MNVKLRILIANPSVKLITFK